MLKKQANAVINEVIDKASLKEGSLIVIGCSSSEVLGDRMGTNSSVEIADCLYEEISKVLNDKGIDLAVQCCEHLNRAIVLEKKVALINKCRRNIYNRHIGEAIILAGRHRPKFIGGQRAVYDEELK